MINNEENYKNRTENNARVGKSNSDEFYSSL